MMRPVGVTLRPSNYLGCIMQKLAWGKKVDANFRAKLFAIAEDFRWTPEKPGHLMGCMAFETAETFSPSVRNAAGSGAVGLIQFMGPTAVGLGTTTATLATLTAVDQLDYVKAYFKPYAKNIKTFADMYMAILMPKYVGFPDSTIIIRDPGVTYRQNAGLDFNKDGCITKEEAAGLAYQKYQKGMLEAYAL